MVGIVLLGVFVLLLALGAPIAVCLGMSSVSAVLVQGAGKPLEAIMSVLPRLCSSASSTRLKSFSALPKSWARKCILPRSAYSVISSGEASIAAVSRSISCLCSIIPVF